MLSGQTGHDHQHITRALFFQIPLAHQIDRAKNISFSTNNTLTEPQGDPCSFHRATPWDSVNYVSVILWLIDGLLQFFFCPPLPRDFSKLCVCNCILNLRLACFPLSQCLLVTLYVWNQLFKIFSFDLPEAKLVQERVKSLHNSPAFKVAHVSLSIRQSSNSTPAILKASRMNSPRPRAGKYSSL